jgi:hypothetical protein
MNFHRNAIRCAAIVGLAVTSLVALTMPMASTSASAATRPHIALLSPLPAGRARGGAWRSSGLAGGGMISQVSISPTDPSRVIAVGDVSGTFWSSDAGGHWHCASGYALAEYQLQLAGVSWDRGHPGSAYAIGAYPGSNGGIFRTKDYGHSWRATTNQVSGLGDGIYPALAAITGLPDSPRPLGPLLAIDDTNQEIYAGTFETGVVRASLRSDLSTATWQTIALAPGSFGTAHWYIYALVNDPSDPQTVYVATHDSILGNAGGGHIWRITDAASQTPTVSELSGSPVDAQDLLVLHGNLYAANATGIWRLAGAKDAAPSSVFSLLPAPPTATSIDFWYSLAGYSKGGLDHLWAGGSASGVAPLVQTLASATSADHFQTAPTWSVWPTSTNGVSPRLVGSGGVWWRTLGNSFHYGEPSGPETVTSVAVTASDPNLVMTSDAYAIWRSTDGGTNWRPSADGLGNTVNTAVATDPRDPTAVFVANMDSVFLESDNHGRTFVSDMPTNSDAPVGRAISVDATTTPSTVYLGVSQYTGLNGQIWSKTNMFGIGSAPNHGWTQLLSSTDPALGSAMGQMPTGLIVIRDDKGLRTAITCLNGHGVWYRSLGLGGWTAATSRTSDTEVGLGRCRFTHADGSSVVYLYDTATGLWRSDDSGASFVRILPGSEGDLQGYVAIDPLSTSDIFLSLGSGVYQVANASTASSDQAHLQPLAAGVVANPGAITTCDHHLVVAQPPQPPGTASRLFTANLSHPSVWTHSGLAYSASSTAPSGVACSPDGWLYESEEGEGLIERRPVVYRHAINRTTPTVRVHVASRMAIASVKISVNGKSFRAMTATRRVGNYKALVTLKGTPGENIRNTIRIRAATTGRRPLIRVRSVTIVVALS